MDGRKSFQAGETPTPHTQARVTQTSTVKKQTKHKALKSATALNKALKAQMYHTQSTQITHDGPHSKHTHTQRETPQGGEGCFFALLAAAFGPDFDVVCLGVDGSSCLLFCFFLFLCCCGAARWLALVSFALRASCLIGVRV